VVALLLAAVVLPTALPGGHVAAQGAVVAQRARVEAAFLRNFARYVTWPAQTFPAEHSPWTVCVAGGNHFDESLERTFEGRLEQGRAFRVWRAVTMERLDACQIVFVDMDNGAARRDVLGRVKNSPVLTVGSAPEFLREGGVIRLAAGETVEMSVNLDQARQASLVIPAKLLEVSHEVLENGTLRRLR